MSSEDKDLTRSEIELGVQLLNLDTERDLAPPMADLVRTSHEIADTIRHPDSIEDVKTILLTEDHPFKQRLGLMVLRHSTQKYSERCIPILLDFLNNPYAWNRYEAMWGLITSRVSDRAVLNRIFQTSQITVSTHDADLKFKKMGELFYKAQQQRTKYCESLQVRTMVNVIPGVMFDWPEIVDFKIKAQGAGFFHAQGNLDLAKEESMIQFSEFNKSEITFTISELIWDEDITFEDYIQEMANYGSKQVLPKIEKIVSSVPQSYMVSGASSDQMFFIKKTILFNKRLIEYTAEFDPRDKVMWENKLRQLVHTLDKIYVN